MRRSPNKPLRILALALLTMSMAFVGCENDNLNNLAGPVIDNQFDQSFTDADSSWQLYKKGVSVLVDEEEAEPLDNVSLKVGGDHINDAQFKMKDVDVTQNTLFRLEKEGLLINTYRLEPFGITAEEIKIKMYYTHSALPLDVSPGSLKIMKKENGQWIPLETKVKGKDRKLEATVTETGEFSMGGYDDAGNLVMILGGEYGLRVEKECKPGQKKTIKLGYGSEVQIMKNSLTEKTMIGIIATPETIQGIGDAKNFTFTPHGTVFNEPIHLVLSWAELNGEDITLYYFNEATGEWEVNAEGVWDEKDKTVTLELNHFSRYALAAD